MKRLVLLASVAALAVSTVPVDAAAPEPAAVAVVIPEPQPAPAPRGILGGLFKRKQRPVETPVEIVEVPVADASAPAPSEAPINLVPTGSVEAEAGPPAVAEPAPKLAFKLRRVADDEVPLPRANPLRAPVAVAEVEVPVEVPVQVDVADAAPIPIDPPADPAPAEVTLEPDVPPPAAVATETPIVVVEAEPAIRVVTPETPPSDLPDALTMAAPAEAVPAAVETAEPAAMGAPLAPALAEPTTAVPNALVSPDQAEPDAPVVAAASTEAAAEEATPDQRMAAEKLVAAANDTESPRELVDLLSSAQDDIAVGSVPALAAQRRIRARIDDVFATAAPDVWQEPADAVAAVTYVLSGGAPDILLRFADMEPKPAVDERLPRGALAYVEGRQGEAAGMLVDLDAATLPARLGGQVALAQAALLVGTDPKAALARLDMARLIAPGTLVEEAAIRRSLFIVDQLHDEARFEMLARQYLARFKHSIYAGNFRYRFAAALTHAPLLDDPAQFGRLDAMLAQLDPEAQRGLYLTVASAAVVAGKMEAGAYAAEKAIALAGAESPDLSRAHVYRAAALVVDPEGFETAEKDIAATNVAMLQASDRALYDAVAGIATSIREGSDPTTIAIEPAPLVLPGEEPPAEPDALLDRAKALSDEVGVLLASAS